MKNNNHKINIVCKICGKPFIVHFYRRKTAKCCSERCRRTNLGRSCIGTKRAIKRRLVNTSGYILVLARNHPYKNSGFYVREHRLVVEKIIGRFLLPTEEVHHLDHNRKNNKPHNLMAFKSKSAHLRFEWGKPVNKNEIIYDGRRKNVKNQH